MRSRKHIYRKLLCSPYLVLAASFFWKTTVVCAQPTEEPQTNLQAVKQALLPLPMSPHLDEKKLQLGLQLFNDPILSGSEKLACSSCHDLSRGGDDGLQFSLTDKKIPRTLNTPTIFNTNHNFSLLWSGKFESLNELLDAIITSPATMNAKWEDVLRRLESQPDYVKAFNASYTDGVTRENLVDILATLQRSLVTPNSRFDQYLNGDNSALTPKEKQGYSLFYSYGCTSCHQGKNIGGNMFQKFGLFSDYYQDSDKTPREADLGRYNITGNKRDKFFFRVPSLRNVAVTAPYLHNGSIDSLDEVIRIMGVYQLGREIPESDRRDIEAFLNTLTGQYNDQPFVEE
ncbi:cytochrome B6 [Alteromonadaceae bacterium M269]|nr:cytochrome B6 [Alteromonadaceae bacterium M269]